MVTKTLLSKGKVSSGSQHELPSALSYTHRCTTGQAGCPRATAEGKPAAWWQKNSSGPPGWQWKRQKWLKKNQVLCPTGMKILPLIQCQPHQPRVEEFNFVPALSPGQTYLNVLSLLNFRIHSDWAHTTYPPLFSWPLCAKLQRSLL